MLQVEPAAGRRSSQRRIALALAGGGPLGAFYQLGCLHALVDCTEGLELTGLDAYVGVSSGSIIAAALANGVSTDEMIRMFFLEDDAAAYPLTPGVLMRPALDELANRALSLPSLFKQALARLVSEPFQSWAAVLNPLLQAIPNGVFDNRPFEEYLRKMLSAEGRSNDFRELRTMLRVIATDLNSGTEVCFGAPGFDHVPISQAIRASTALPGLYTPVHLDGQTYVDGALLRTVHASLVLDHGADLVISINPLVTFDASAQRPRRAHHDLAEAGLITVLSQTFRALIRSRMQIGMAAYRDRYPYSDRLLFEPDRDDATMFFANVFRYQERCRLANHAYQQTRRDLLASVDTLAPLLQHHGVAFRHDRLRDARRTFETSVRQRHGNAAVTDELESTLQELSDWLHCQA